MRCSTPTEKLGDKALVTRLRELLEARRALEVALTGAVSEYARRRAKAIRAGEQLGPLDPPTDNTLALDHNVRAAMQRREDIARDHYAADQAALRHGPTRALLTS